MREWWSKIRAMLIARRELPDDLTEEMDAHLEMDIQENISRGMSPEEAREAAQRGFGNRTAIQESAREAWMFERLENFCKDVAYAGRMMRKNPGFASTAIITLALGIGANTAIFTVIRAVLLKPLAYLQPDRLVRISIDNAQQGYHDVGFTLARYREMKTASRSFSELGAFFIASEHMTLSGAEPEQITVARVSANFLHVLGVKPLMGRGFLPEEDRPGGPHVVLISAPLWKRRFGRDPVITGKTMTLNATPYAITGVLPDGFQFPAAGMDAWLTRPAEYSEVPSQFWSRLTILIGLGRLKPQVSLEQARAEFAVLNRQYISAHAGLADAVHGVSVRAVLLRDELVENARTMLWILFGAVGFVLIIACVNVASLLLARAASRSREFAVRAALGAGRGRLIRQLLAESLLLATSGGVLGVFLAKWSLHAITRLSAFHLPRAGEIHLDGVVLAFTLALSVAIGVLFGLFPSFQVSRPSLVDLLRERGDGAHQGLAGRAALRLRARAFLVIGQAALSVVLLIGAALLMKSFARLHSVNPGFRPAHLLTMRIDLPPVRYDTAQKKQAFFRELVRRVEALPGIRGAAAVLTLPMSPRHAIGVQVIGQPNVNVSDRPSALLQSVTPGYFLAAGIPLRRGREFTARDNVDGAPLVAIINESFARRFWPDYPRGHNPVGEGILIGDNTSGTIEIIGIAADVHERGFPTGASPELYLTDHLYPLQTAGLVVRTDGDPLRFAASIRSQVLAIDRNQPVSAVQTMDELLDSSVGQQRLTMVLLASFAGMALLLAAIGIYGVIAYSVVQRTQELGIRRALGAQRGDILRLIVGQALGLTAAGVGLGILGALELTRVMSGLLFRVSATDPIAFTGVALVFLIVALAASYIPARRATRVDPMVALR